MRVAVDVSDATTFISSVFPIGIDFWLLIIISIYVVIRNICPKFIAYLLKFKGFGVKNVIFLKKMGYFCN